MWLMRKTWLSRRSLGFGDVLGRGYLCYQPPGDPWTWGIWRISLVGTSHKCCDNALLGEIWCIGEIHCARSPAPSFPFAECAWYHFTLILLSPVSPWSKSLNLRVTLGTSKHTWWARKTTCLPAKNSPSNDIGDKAILMKMIFYKLMIKINSS